jgi:hypothetical protein
MLGRALGGAQRNAAQLEHGQEIRVRELVLQAEAHDVEVAQRRVALERHERQPRARNNASRSGHGA